MKRFLVLIFALFLPVFVQAAIENPYVVDEKPQVIFGDSVLVLTYFGLENYTQNYVGGYAHITFTYTHHSCCFSNTPPRVYVTNTDPRATSTPVVKANDALFTLFQFTHPTDWYLYDVQFDSEGYTISVKQSGETEIFNEHRIISDLADSDWVALANLHPFVPPPDETKNAMAFTPVPVKEEPPFEECCSSVVFLPGIKGSVLKSGPDTLWPATFFGNDLPALALTEDGESVNDVYVDGILQEFAGTNIYLPFSTFLDGLVSENLINGWLPLAYDWRFSIDKILEEGVKTENEVLNVIEEIENLASQSQTGQVTIIAHSMGGLLGKAIIKELEEQGKDNLIDSFVMVGTPQLGTPQAIGALLHGYDEDILGGFVVSMAQARTLSQNLPSAHNLLPSRQYFGEVADPVITFDSQASFTQEWRDFWNGTSTKSYEDFVQFITGTGVSREKPGELDLRIPEVLRTDLVNTAGVIHQTYDNYALPSHIRTVQVAGWGLPTVKAIHYRNRHGQPSYDVSFTVEGDKTVVYKSAIASVEETYFFNIEKYRKDTGRNTQHRNLLNEGPTTNIIQSLLQEEPIVTDEYTSTIIPPVSNLEDQLIVSVHSPVLLGVYDEFDNFTGVDPNQDLSQDILSITENIPGSIFLYTSESQYIFLPKEGTYNFVYKGIGNGSTTIEMKNFVADATVPIASYSDIPTTESTTATFEVDSENPDITVIKLDTNSDEELDEIIVSDDTDIYDLLVFLKEKIESLNIKEKLKYNLLKKIENLEKKIAKKTKKDKSLENLKKKIENLIKRILKKEVKGIIGEVDANEIIKLLEQVGSEL